MAQDLHQFANVWLDSLNVFTDQLQEKSGAAKGLVRFAKPESCLWTDAYQIILQQLTKLKDIRIDIAIAPSEEIIDGVLKDQFDFGFIVGEEISPDLRFEKFSEEKYIAVHADGKNHGVLFDGKTPIRIVTYPGWEGYFDIWSKHHRIPKSVRSKLVSVVNVGSIAGAIEAMSQGAGVAVLPAQCVKRNFLRKNAPQLAQELLSLSLPYIWSSGATIPHRHALKSF